MDFEKAIAKFNEETMKLVGQAVASVEHKDWGTMVYLDYGTAHFEFNSTGYNYLYNMKTLYNNPVMDALME